MTEMKLSPLDARHRELGAKMADFGGWEMPIEYPGGGVVREHTAVRESVGIFDVSHLGKATVSGPGALDFVNARLTNDIRKVGIGKAQYTMCCAPDGGVVDDLIVYVRSEDELFLIPNASNTADVVARLAAEAPAGITVRNQHEEFAVLAVQGPESGSLLSDLGLPTDHGYMSFVDAELNGLPMTVCRTGYTGEHGYELVCAWDDAPAVWDVLVEAAAKRDGLPCGLGARDTLRTEMGYPLHGHELSLDITPVQARAGWAVGWKKDAFWGKDALVREKEQGPTRTLRGLKVTGRGIPRAHCAVRSLNGDDLGEVTSGTFSPTLKEGIALALLTPAVQDGETVVIDVRGRALEAVVTKPPFVEVTPAG